MSNSLNSLWGTDDGAGLAIQLLRDVLTEDL